MRSAEFQNTNDKRDVRPFYFVLVEPWHLLTLGAIGPGSSLRCLSSEVGGDVRTSCRNHGPNALKTGPALSAGPFLTSKRLRRQQASHRLIN